MEFGPTSSMIQPLHLSFIVTAFYFCPTVGCQESSKGLWMKGWEEWPWVLMLTLLGGGVGGGT